MRKNGFILMSALALLVSACVRTQFDESGLLGENQFSASVEGAPTKVSMNEDYSLYWEAGDKVSVFAPDNVNREFAAASSGSETILDGPQDYVVDASAAHYALYPYSEDNSISDGIITTEIPYEQTPRKGSFPENFSVAKTNGGKSLKFYNVCGLMGFKITRSDIVRVTLKSAADDEYVVGKIAIDCENITNPTYTVLEGRTEVSLVNKNGFEAGDYYVAMLPRRYTGMTVTMYTADGKVGYVQNKAGFTLNRSNHIKPLAVDTKPLEGALLARWEFPVDNSTSTFKTGWVENNALAASQGQGTISYHMTVTDKGTATRTVGSTGAAIVKGAWPGDYWLYEVPVSVPSNTSYSINFRARVSDYGHKFWMLEYYDGSQWLPAADVQTSSETGQGVSYTHAMVNDDATVSASFIVKNTMESLKIRYRCVANWLTNGSGALSQRNTGTVRMSQAGGATIDIWALDPIAQEPVTKTHSATQWIISGSAWNSSWTSSNSLKATSGDYSSSAYISTTTSGPERYVYDSKAPAVKNLKAGDCIYFTVPGQTLSQSAIVTFGTNMMAQSGSAVSNWVLEYKKNGEWVAAGEDNDFYIKYFSAYQYTTFSQNFTLGAALNNQPLELRIRLTSLSSGSSADVAFVKSAWQGVNIDIWDSMTIKDTKKILALGNSFSYYHSTNFMLQQLAMSQGHDIKIHAHFKGSQTFAMHLNLERSLNAIAEGGFDYAFIQDQSQQHANYYMDPTAQKAVLDDTKTLVSKIKAQSSNCQPILEATWSYSDASYGGYADYERFDKALQGGALLISDAANTWMSPIGAAFQKARAEGISLYHTDNKHPGPNGSYLKACVNYLMIYGQAFDANASDCIIDAATAAKLRRIAEEVVLADINKYRNPDSSGVTPGELELPEVSETEIELGNNGISTPGQLISFAKLVNSGGDISSYCNSKGEVVLLNDVELSKNAWVPIGAVSGIAEDAAPTPTVAFTGVFDGKGFVITGLQIVVSDNATTTSGFFGALSGATVRNVTFEDVVMTYNSTGVSADHISIGTLAGYALNSTIDNVKVYADYSGVVTSTKTRNVTLGGVVGTLAATTDLASSVSNCMFEGTVTNDIGTKYSGTNSVTLGGIVGAVTNNSVNVKITKCTNNADFDVKVHRVGGVVGSGPRAKIEDCENYGDINVVQSTSKVDGSPAGVRAGGIVAYNRIYAANDSYVKNCRNYGTISTTEEGSAVGGVVGLAFLTTIEGCRNTGNVYAPEGFRGLLIGRVSYNKNAVGTVTFTNCSYSGSVGATQADAVAATSENYLNLGAAFDEGVSPVWTTENIHLLQ